MTIKEYLNKRLENQSMEEEGSDISNKKKEIKSIIEKYFEDSTPEIKYGGSIRKKTAIKTKYDVDILCIFKRDDNDEVNTIKEIYDSVFNCLNNKDYNYYPEAKNASIKIKCENFDIDVVPARYTNTEENDNDLFLYQNDGDKNRLKTNIEKQIKHVQDSKLINTIRILKLWKAINSIDIKTFVLELLIIKLLEKEKDSDGLEITIKSFFEKVISYIDSIAIEDPANPNNDLSSVLSKSKSMLKAYAQIALNNFDEENIKNVFGEIEEASKDYKIDTINKMKDNGLNPKPYAKN